jgi:UDP-N-acetylglucosamine--N-acetylmuramyl-(pentapeptide) pyrophosphoryl-undecaprenol N-acetylglucosamine transferase
MRLVVAGGGTGGHLYPGIAVARELLRREPAATVSFAGTASGLEARVVPLEGFDLDVIRSAGIKGKSIASRARGAALVPVGMGDAWRIISRRKPNVVMGVGGYSSGPVVLAAALRRVPTLVLEQNAVPGLTNRILARWVSAAAVSYEETLGFFRGKGFVAGNPVRDEFFQTAPLADGTSHARRVLVLGGSQGAHAINVAVVASARELAQRLPNLTLVHQTGERDLTSCRTGYAGAGLDVRVEAFFPQVAAEVAAADLVVGRAGATTLAELAAAGRPAVLIPFPGATDDHQRKNAEAVARSGGAVVIDQRELSPQRIADTITELLSDQRRLEAMASAMRSLAKRDAARRIVDRLIELARPERRVA